MLEQPKYRIAVLTCVHASINRLEAGVTATSCHSSSSELLQLRRHERVSGLSRTYTSAAALQRLRLAIRSRTDRVPGTCSQPKKGRVELVIYL